MIIKDKSIYLDFVKDIETKVNTLCNGLDSIAMTKENKREIQRICAKISATILMITNLANQESGLIPNIEWVGYKKELNGLYKELTDKVCLAKGIMNIPRAR